MPRPIDPSKRYLSDNPCPTDQTYYRYKKSGHCCECVARWNGTYNAGIAQPAKPQVEAEPAAHPHVVPVTDAIAPISRARLMAGK